MGTFYVKIDVGDIDGERFEQMDALVDTGAMTTVIPASILRRLGVEPVKSEVFEYAGGQEVELDMAYATVRVDGRGNHNLGHIRGRDQRHTIGRIHA